MMAKIIVQKVSHSLTRIIFSTVPHSKDRTSGLSGEYVIIEADQKSDPTLTDAEVLLVGDISWLNKLEFGKMSKLRLIQITSAGVDSIDFERIPPEVIVCGNVGAYAEQIAEHVFGMILCLAKDLIFRNEQLRNSIYDRQRTLFLKGRTIGILGTGGIGKAVARLAKAFGMVTLGINSSGIEVEYFDEVSNLSGLNRLFGKSDVIVVALPLTVRTLNLIDSRSLRLCKKDCILVNVGRGRVIDEKALYDQLLDNPSFKAGIDVWWRYSERGTPFVQNYPFFDLPNFLGSPHDSGYVSESEEIALEYALINIRRCVEGQSLLGVAKREDYQGLRLK